MIMPSPFDLVEDSLKPTPRFAVEPPDNRKDVAELPRQVAFLSLMRMVAPSIEVRALPNAGKRNPSQAKKEGIKAGTFDLGLWWPFGGHALIEMKGWTGGKLKLGKYVPYRAGKLSPEQIDFGNLLHDMGIPVGCFFNAEAAVEWLRHVGAPVRMINNGEK